MTGTRVEVASAADAVSRVRAAAPGEDVLLVLPASLPQLEDALARAALGPLAAERAPARVNAVALGPEADPADAEATARFLEGARSTTGQVLEVR